MKKLILSFRYLYISMFIIILCSWKKLQIKKPFTLPALNSDLDRLVSNMIYSIQVEMVKQYEALLKGRCKQTYYDNISLTGG